MPFNLRRRIGGIYRNRYNKFGKRRINYKRNMFKSMGYKNSGQLGMNKVINTNQFGFPDTYMCKLKYNDSYQLIGSLGGTGSQVFRANSLQDPDFTGIGHQPRFYDELQNVYGKYVVLACKCKVNWSNSSSTVPADCIISFSVSDPTGSTYNSLNENRYSKWLQVGPSGGMGVKVNSMYMKISKLFGQSEIAEDNAFYSTNTANPTNTGYVAVAVKATDNASTTNVYATVTLTYYCLFKQVKIVSVS